MSVKSVTFVGLCERFLRWCESGSCHGPASDSCCPKGTLQLSMCGVCHFLAVCLSCLVFSGFFLFCCSYLITSGVGVVGHILTLWRSQHFWKNCMFQTNPAVSHRFVRDFPTDLPVGIHSFGVAPSFPRKSEKDGVASATWTCTDFRFQPNDLFLKSAFQAVFHMKWCRWNQQMCKKPLSKFVDFFSLSLLSLLSLSRVKISSKVIEEN